MIVVFDFNASLNDVAPVSSMPFPVDAKRREKSELLMDVFGVSFFLLSSQLRSSSVSAAFDFNDSLNDFAPVSPMLFTFDVKRKEKNYLLICVICAFFFVFTYQIKFRECCV